MNTGQAGRPYLIPFSVQEQNTGSNLSEVGLLNLGYVGSKENLVEAAGSNLMRTDEGLEKDDLPETYFDGQMKVED